ncbi:hypothetical protein V1L54_29005 [Streptomyces sp. TRM 70361]|uniref:hypothetical protein n=1 Tax=Streptomyces sp. TRM 70361 TaxID=3116553 RepID=UPI002E7C1E9A|nr:hypothetical protein [Streptomyces sp. TRM 70361]MEE1943396.1 hypothetical protein [Streptomyces sp. TRM 70361]
MGASGRTGVVHLRMRPSSSLTVEGFTQERALRERADQALKEYRAEIRRYFRIRECALADSGKAADELAKESRADTSGTR